MSSWIRTNLVLGVLALITTGRIWGQGVGTLKGRVTDPWSRCAGRPIVDVEVGTAASISMTTVRTRPDHQ